MECESGLLQALFDIQLPAPNLVETGHGPGPLGLNFLIQNPDITDQYQTAKPFSARRHTAVLPGNVQGICMKAQENEEHSCAVFFKLSYGLLKNGSPPRWTRIYGGIGQTIFGGF